MPIRHFEVCKAAIHLQSRDWHKTETRNPPGQYHFGEIRKWIGFRDSNAFKQLVNKQAQQLYRWGMQRYLLGKSLDS